MIFDEHLKDLSKYRVLVLPDSECLSDEQLALVRRFVEAGGGLVATGQAGLYDECRQLRGEPGLRALVGQQPSAQAYEETVEEGSLPSGPELRREFGKGRVVYFPGVEFDGALPVPEPYFTIGNRFWKRPKNWAAIVEGVRWAAQDDIPVRVDGPEYLVANLVEQPEQQRRLLHLMNYSAKNVPVLESVEVECRLPQGRTAREIRVLSPDGEEPRTLDFSTGGAAISFTVPRIKTYAVAVVSW